MRKGSSVATDQDVSETGTEFGSLNEELVEHHKLGVWDVYVMDSRSSSWNIEKYVRIWEDIPYLWMALRDMSTVAWPLLLLYLIITSAMSLIPALDLWFSGQVLKTVQSAIDNRDVDVHLLFWVAGGRVLCATAGYTLAVASAKVANALDGRARQLYSGPLFRSMVRLDVPTWADPAVHIHTLHMNSDIKPIALSAIATAMEMVSAFLKMFCEVAILFRVLREHENGSLLVLASLASEAVSYISLPRGSELGHTWAAITRDSDYIRMQGLNRLVKDTRHRKEIVAGGLDEFLTTDYCSLADRLGTRAVDFWSACSSRSRNQTFEFFHLLRLPLTELPQLIFALQAVQKPSSVPISLASLHLLQKSIGTFVGRFRAIFFNMGGISHLLSDLQMLYEAVNIPNKVVDGSIPFPENAQSISNGISLEFRDVSFQYPGCTNYALHRVSFRVLPGQLCVIVGSNGSGKSTILKLAARIYDPTEGSIYIDGYDIKTLKLADLRRAVAILFQDYTHFPLTIRDNIALGNPRRTNDNAAIEEAARLAGAYEFIVRLPNGFDTYLERPVHDIRSPDMMKTLFGQKFVNARLRLMDDAVDQELSGGQMQRLAVARTFMRSLTMEKEVGLLLFDEPSASLDPTAEHDLFSRLRKLRGNKTTIFSTHRFGNLTRHADLILFMNGPAIVETGTHEELLKHESSDYGRLWRMQAQAFL